MYLCVCLFVCCFGGGGLCVVVFFVVVVVVVVVYLTVLYVLCYELLILKRNTLFLSESNDLVLFSLLNVVTRIHL